MRLPSGVPRKCNLNDDACQKKPANGTSEKMQDTTQRTTARDLREAALDFKKKLIQKWLYEKLPPTPLMTKLELHGLLQPTQRIQGPRK